MSYPAARAAHTPTNTVSHETRRIEMAAVICIGCHQPASLDEARLCLHCRTVPTEKSAARIQKSAGGGSDALV